MNENLGRTLRCLVAAMFLLAEALPVLAQESASPEEPTPAPASPESAPEEAEVEAAASGDAKPEETESETAEPEAAKPEETETAESKPPEPTPEEVAATEAAAEEARLEALEEAAENQRAQMDSLAAMLSHQGRRVASRDSMIVKQQGQLETLQAAVKQQKDRLAEADSTTEAQRRELEQVNSLVLDLANRLRELEDAAPLDSLATLLDERMARLEKSVEELPEIPPDIITAGDFPGSMAIPGTGAAIRFGGQVRVSYVHTYDALGSEDRFITATIPMPGTQDSKKGSRVSLSAATSRFNLDLRTPTTFGQMRVFLEGDFAGGDNSDLFRLRHAYGQYGRVIVGQTWSTLVDLKASPVEVDFEGLNARIQFRQTQVRVFNSIGDQASWAVAAENPKPDLTGIDGISQIPDLTARVSWSSEEDHVQMGLLLRSLRAEPTDKEPVATVGFGLNLSTSITVPYLDDRDHLILSLTAGQGIGRYITDLRSEGGQDAVYDSTTNTLTPLEAFAGYVALHHYWGANLHSTAVWGYVYVDNLEIQAGSAYHQTNRVSGNLMFKPISRLELGAEYIYGTRENKDEARGTARQLQVVGTFWY